MSLGRLIAALGTGATRALLGTVAFFSFCALAHADEAAAPPRELKSDTKEHVDAVLLLDGSGSMRLTDPAKLREEGARLFTQFLKEGDRLAVVSFADEAKVLRPLDPYVKEAEEEIASAIVAVGDSGEYTDILAGIQEAATLLRENGREDATKIIVLFSDGKMDPRPEKTSREKATTELLLHVLPDLKAQGIAVDTLAFSDQVDKELLAQIALGTEGEHFFTPEADKIHKSFADLFVAVKKPQIVPLTSKGFRIDPDIQEATFYINRENVPEVSVESPSGRKYIGTNEVDGVKWYRGQKFDVVTILKPEVGSWQVNGLPPNDSFATVLTNVKLVTDYPTKLNSADPVLLQAQLFEAEKPIILPKMTGEVRYAYQITPTDKVSEPIIREFLVDDGTNGDKRAADGIFTAKVVLEEEGEYRLRVVAQGPTFERTQQMMFRVKPRLVSLSLSKTEIHEQMLEGEENKPAEPLTVDVARVELSPDATELKKISVEALAVNKQSRKRYKLPLRQSRENPLFYDTFVSRLLQDGEYDLVATLSGETKKGREVKVSSQIVLYKKSSVHNNAGGEDHVEELVEQKVERKTKSKIPYYLIVTVANGLAAWLLLKMFFKSKTSMEFEARVYKQPAHVLAAIGVLEERLAIAEVDFAHPIFSDESIEIKIREGGFEAPGAPASAEAAGQGADGAAPPTDADGEAKTPEAGATAPADSSATPESKKEGE